MVTWCCEPPMLNPFGCLRLWWNEGADDVAEDIDAYEQVIHSCFELTPRLMNGFDIIVFLQHEQDGCKEEWENHPNLFHVGCSDSMAHRWGQAVRSRRAAAQMASTAERLEDFDSKQTFDFVRRCMLARKRIGSQRIKIRVCQDERRLVTSFDEPELEDDFRVTLRCVPPFDSNLVRLSITAEAGIFSLKLQLLVQPTPRRLDWPPPLLSGSGGTLWSDAVWSPIVNYCGLESLLKLGGCSKTIRRCVLSAYHLRTTGESELIRAWLDKHVLHRSHNLYISTGPLFFLLESLPVFQSEYIAFVCRLLNRFDLVCEICSLEEGAMSVETSMGSTQTDDVRTAISVWRAPGCPEDREHDLKCDYDEWRMDEDWWWAHWLRISRIATVDQTLSLQIQPSSCFRQLPLRQGDFHGTHHEFGSSEKIACATIGRQTI